MRIEFSRRLEVMGAEPASFQSAGLSCVQSVTYFFQSVAAGHWIGTDELEFRAEEKLSGDEVAQALYMLSGGVPGHQCGHVGGFCVEYDPNRPAVLRLHAQTGTDIQVSPRIYYMA
jgi:hypothetical protein